MMTCRVKPEMIGYMGDWATIHLKLAAVMIFYSVMVVMIFFWLVLETILLLAEKVKIPTKAVRKLTAIHSASWVRVLK